MSELKYRALLIDPGNATQDRPIQIFANDRAEVDRWAAAVLNQAVSEVAAVNVYQMTEQHIAIISKKGKPA